MYRLTWALLLLPQLCLPWIPVALWTHPPGIWDLALAGLLHGLGQLGVSLGYHRWLTHKSFVPARPLGWILLALAPAAGVGPALWWVAIDRAHHRFCQKEGDPHCPIHPETQEATPWTARFGFAFTRLGREIPWRELPEAKVPALAWIQAAYLPGFLLWFLAPFALTFFVQQDLPAALRALFWASGVRIALGQWTFARLRDHAHRGGTPAFPGRHQSRNLPGLWLVSLGEAWHGNHHAFPRSARLGFGWRQPDLGFWVLRLGESLGWIEKLKDESEKARERQEKLEAKREAKRLSPKKGSRRPGKKSPGASSKAASKRIRRKS